MVFCFSRVFVSMECTLCYRRLWHMAFSCHHWRIFNIEPVMVYVILVRNMVLAVLVYGGWHMWLYVWRSQHPSNTIENGLKNIRNASHSIIKHMIICAGHWLAACRLDMLRSVALVLCKWLCDDNFPFRKSSSIYSIIFFGPICSRGWVLFRPPFFALAAVISYSTLFAPPEQQPGPVVRPVDAPTGTFYLFFFNSCIFNCASTPFI